MFGREDRGLSNDELQKCTFHVNIPTNREYSSLNLAMAVQILCYEIKVASCGNNNILLNGISHLPPQNNLNLFMITCFRY